MTTVRELNATFTATVTGFRNAASAIRNELKAITKETQRTNQQLTSNFTGVTRSLNSVERSFTQAFGEGAEESRELNEIIGRMRDEFRETGRVSEASVSQLQDAIERARLEISQTDDTSSETFRRMESDLNDTRREVEVLQQSLTEANRRLDEMGQNDLDDVSGDINNVDESTQNLSGSLVKGAAKAIAFVGAFMGIGAAATMTDELQQAVDKLQNNTGATKGEIDGMRDSLMEVYKGNYGENFMDIADSMAVIQSSTNLTGEALEDATKQAILLRDQFGWDISETLLAARSMMNEFGYSIEEAFTILAQGQQGGLGLSDDLLGTFHEYSSAWHDIGFNGEQALNMISSGIQAGAKDTDIIGDMVNEFATRIFDGSKTTTDALGLLGLNVDDTVNRFKKGGPEATGAFQDVIKAIQNTEDAQLKENAAVGLFGSLAEDNGLRVITALGEVEGQANKTADTLGKMDANGFNTIGEVVQWTGRNIMAYILLPLQEKVMPAINNFIKMSISGFKQAKEAMQPFVNGFKDLLGLFTGDQTAGINVLEKLGLSAAQVQTIINFINLIKKSINGFISEAQSGFAAFGVAFQHIWAVLGPYIKPLLQDIANFIFGIVSKITSFWNENGSMIMTAVKNAFGFILATIQFIMPAVLFIINSVWGAIKGVINGALNIIMGAIKIFAGLFTGNWSKLWEGVKQLLSGALQFLWNLFNLMILGKLFGGIKSFATGAINWFRNIGTNIKSLWSGMVDGVVTRTNTLISRVIGFFKGLLRDGRSLFGQLKGFITGIFDDVVKAAKNLPGRIGDGIRSMAGKVADGLRSLANKMNAKLSLGVNGVIDGVNWVLEKVGLGDKSLKRWVPDEYAQGTEKNGHGGGLAYVGDGGKKELVIYPDGQMFLSPNKATLVNLPKGTHVISGPETEQIIPAYKDGTVKRAIKKGVGWVKDKALDVWEYASNPSKLLAKVLEKFGVEMPSLPGVFKDAGKGAFTKVKDGVKDFLSRMMDKIGGEAPNVSGNASAWKSQIMRAAGAMNEGITGRQLNGIIAQIQRESGGNQRIVQSPLVDDINTRNGNPARGLLQYIPQTFRAYAVRGYEDIYNGYHQLLAFFNNRNWRSDLPYGQSGWGPSGGRKINGFWEGARVAAKQMAWIAEKGAEYIIPTDGGQRAYDLWSQAGAENGFTQVTNTIEPGETVVENHIYLDGKEIAKGTHRYTSLYQAQEQRIIRNNGKAKIKKQ